MSSMFASYIRFYYSSILSKISLNLWIIYESNTTMNIFSRTMESFIWKFYPVNNCECFNAKIVSNKGLNTWDIIFLK